MNLVTLAQAEAWLGVTSDSGGPVDTRVAGLVSAVTTSILAFLDRSDLISKSYTEYRDGTGTTKMILRQWPVTSISTLFIGNQPVPAGSYPGTGFNWGAPGFLFEPWDGTPPGRQCVLELEGYEFWRAPKSTQIIYTAGYLISGEQQAVPAGGGSLTVSQPWGSWAADSGVTYANGTALTKVTGVPAQGQYALGLSGTYTFAAADAGQNVLISYSYIPAALANAALQGVQTLYSIAGRDPLLKSEKYDQVAFSYFQPGQVGNLAPGSAVLTANITSMLMPFKRTSRSA